MILHHPTWFRVVRFYDVFFSESHPFSWLLKSQRAHPLLKSHNQLVGSHHPKGYDLTSHQSSWYGVILAKLNIDPHRFAGKYEIAIVSGRKIPQDCDIVHILDGVCRTTHDLSPGIMKLLAHLTMVNHDHLGMWWLVSENLATITRMTTAPWKSTPDRERGW